jgi:uncharacterized protein (DUF433 family)
MIISDPNFLDGNPIIMGTHITVEQLLEELAQELTIKQLLEAHPELTHEKITAALNFAAESVRFDHVHNSTDRES